MSWKIRVENRIFFFLDGFFFWEGGVSVPNLGLSNPWILGGSKLAGNSGKPTIPFRSRTWNGWEIENVEWIPKLGKLGIFPPEFCVPVDLDHPGIGEGMGLKICGSHSGIMGSRTLKIHPEEFLWNFGMEKRRETLPGILNSQ